MTEIDPGKAPTPPTHGLQGGPNVPHLPKVGGSTSTSGTWHGKGTWEDYKRWLGDKNYKQFLRIICQQIAREIKKDEEKAKKAAKRLKQASTGEDIDYGV